MFYLYEELPQFEDIIPGEGSPPLHHHRPASQQLSLDGRPVQRRLYSAASSLHLTATTYYEESNQEIIVSLYFIEIFYKY